MREIVTTGNDENLSQLYNSNKNFKTYPEILPKIAYFLYCCTKFKEEFLLKFLKKLVNQQQKDTYIYIKLWELFHKKKYEKNNFNNPIDIDYKLMIKRSKKRLDDIKMILEKNNIIIDNNIWIDIGSGDGSLAYLLNETFNLKNIYAIDVVEPHEYFNKKITFINVNSFKDYNELNIKVDVISCFMTLHHIKNYSEVLHSFCKIINKNGYLIIREHNANSLQRKIILDIYDKLFEYSLYDPPESYIDNYKNTVISFYLDINEIIKKCKNNGLSLIYKTSIEELNNVKDFNYAYYLIFKKL